MSNLVLPIALVLLAAVLGWLWVRPGGGRDRARDRAHARSVADDAWMQQVLLGVRQSIPGAHGSGRSLEIPVDGVVVTATRSRLYARTEQMQGLVEGTVSMQVAWSDTAESRIRFEIDYDDAGVARDVDGHVPDDPTLAAAIERLRLLGSTETEYERGRFDVEGIRLGSDPATVIVEGARACAEAVQAIRRLEQS